MSNPTLDRETNRQPNPLNLCYSPGQRRVGLGPRVWILTCYLPCLPVRVRVWLLTCYLPGRSIRVRVRVRVRDGLGLGLGLGMGNECLISKGNHSSTAHLSVAVLTYPGLYL